MQNTLRCITFDLDDTLWECAPVIYQAEQQFYQWLTEHYPRISEGFSPKALIEHRQNFMRDKPDLMYNLTHLRKLWLAELAKLAQYDSDLIEPGFRVFWEARNKVELFDQVENTLERLREHYTIGAISNGNADVNFIGIGHLFDFTVNSEQAGKAKPDKKIFDLAAETAGVAVEQILHVGDDKNTDVLGALNAGAKAAWVTEKPSEWEHDLEPHFIVSHVSELVLLLRSPS